MAAFPAGYSSSEKGVAKVHGMAGGIMEESECDGQICRILWNCGFSILSVYELPGRSIVGDSVLADGNVDAAGSGDRVFYDLPHVAMEELDPGAGTAGVCGCFFLGYVNKFCLLPVDPEYVNPSFISTIGNINWYCGYLVTILFGGVYLLWRMEEMTWKKLLLMAYVTIGFASLATQGSSSGIVTFAVVMFVLFGMSVRDSGRMEVFWQEMTMFSAACLITCVLRRLNIFSRELILEGITDLLTFSIAGIFMTILSGIILYWIHRTRVRRSYPEKMLHRIYCGIAIAVPVMILLVLLLTLINTLAGGALTPNITDPNVTKWLTFNVSWGSARGGTWAAGARCFWEADFLHKIFGVGPDCLYAFLSNEGSVGLQTMVNDRFGGNRLTNAHNEWLTVLVDIGVLGLISYAGMMITAIRDFLRAGESKMLVGACGICVLAYTVNNMFSFQQVMNISTVFVIMGIGENLRSAPERCV